MSWKFIHKSALPFLLIVFLAAGPSEMRSADNAESIASRTAGRAPQIEAALRDGLIRETPAGILEPLGVLEGDLAEIVRAENRDRRAAFSIIANKHKIRPSEVAAVFGRMAVRRARAAGPPARRDGAAPGTETSGPSAAAPSPAALPPPAAAPSSAPLQAKRKEGTSLPLKLLTRPFSSIYAEPDPSSAVVRSNVAPFTAFYVYSASPGWYQIGERKSGEPFGWIQEKDSILWKHNLAMEFTHPADRLPVMFFKEKDILKQIALSAPADRARSAKDLLGQIRHGLPDPVSFPVQAMEPKRATDRKVKFYMMPITDFEMISLEGRDARLLKVAAATLERKNLDFVEASREVSTSAAAAEASLDVVFVMDCSSSMKPAVDATIAAIQGLVSSLAAQPGMESALKFGFWGYRDSPPDMGFDGSPVKNFTPVLQSARDFLATLKRVEVSDNAAGDYAEDVLGGVKAAITDTAWRGNSLRCIVLVGDASGHPEGHKKNSSGTGPSQIRAMADEARIYMATFYIERESPLAPADRRVAEPQYRVLARNRNSAEGKENFTLIKQSQLPEFQGIMNDLARKLAGDLSLVRSGEIPEKSPAGRTSSSGGGLGERIASDIFAGAFVDWLGRQKDTAVAPPGDVEAWVLDRDLADPVKRPLEVKVLVRKNELDNLAKVLDTLITAAIRGEVTGQGFFESLQSAAASAVSAPEQIRNARNLAATGLLPDFLAGLPYKSRLMVMDNQTWNTMSADSQNQLLEQIQSKRKFYEETIKDSSLWKALNPNDSEDDKVAAIPLEQLP